MSNKHYDYEYSHMARERIINHEDGSEIWQRVMFATRDKEVIKILIPEDL